MAKRIAIIISFFVLALAIPMIAEYIDVHFNGKSNLGLDILLYEPFDFFYMLLVFFIFVFINVSHAIKAKKPIWLHVVLSIIIYVAWFPVAFLCVAQLHISLGGYM